MTAHVARGREPFSPFCINPALRILGTRVKTGLRRSYLTQPGPAPEDEKVLTVGDLTLDPLRLSATWKGGAVPLTVTEFVLLQTLVRRPGIVKTRDQLMDAAYPERVSVTDRTIDSHIKRIRRKFQQVDSAFSGLESVYGAGYRYNEPPR